MKEEEEAANLKRDESVHTGLSLEHPVDDPAIRDALMKRAEAEAAQWQMDEETARACHNKEAVNKTVTMKKPFPPSSDVPSNNVRVNQQQQKESEPKQQDDHEEIMKIVADQASLVTAQILKEDQDLKQDHKTTGNKAPLSDTQQSHQLSFSPKGQTDAYMNVLLQMATDINEAAKMEKFETAVNTCNDRHRQSTELAAALPAALPEPNPLQRQQHQPSRPGAYMGVPGEAMQRATTLRFSLVGASAAGEGEPLVQIGDPGDSSALAESQDAGKPNSSSSTTNNNNNIPSANDPHLDLAVANLVLEDPEEEPNMPSADPVDLQHVLQREQKRKKQRLMFILFFAILLIVAAVIVGAVAGTQKNEPEEVYSPSTDAPTVYGSMAPSEVPSSAPTGVLELLFDILPDYTLASINNGSETPQWRAWQWLANHQNITNLPEWRKTQLFALATFFYAFEGDNWYHLVKGHGWMDDTVEECDWFSSGFGFFDSTDSFYEYISPVPPCNSQGQFTSLDLQELQLLGLSPYLPPEITLLTSLSFVDFWSNDIAGPISSLLPTELYEMTGLTHLSLKGNQFTGKIPSEISLLTSLTRLYLADNQLSG
ncbi:unknown protein [Seminavis robusta]|uniref:Uncharacterized protein n=1 Tax=Seminavis robusta TaxID=568900 RepID=A0A9N8DQ00_9STRA|nr:unknown protein [Seminavis robusta]|eukprot:Sro202_g085501.1  (598) ;mRNA; r:72377-74170